MSLMGPCIMSRSSPREPADRGSFIENVKPCMDVVRLSTPPCSSFLLHFELIIRISWVWSHSFVVSLAFAASNLACRLRDTSLRFSFIFFSSISLFNIEQLIVSCVLILLYSQYRPFLPFTGFLLLTA